VPSNSFPLSVQTGVPVPHAVTPVLQGSAGSHVAPASQALQVPPPQTALVPQLAPSVTLAPVSTQTEAPLVHEVVPTWHAFAGSHPAFATQALQTPPLQTRSVPQLEPSGTLVPVSTQMDTPVAHEVAPTWHASVGTHGAFATHAAHAPPLQTAPSPQSVPFGRGSDSVQTGAPVSQVVVAVVHGFGDTQAAPASHAVHVPPPQTRSSPQLAPFSTFTPVSTQTDTPVAHDVRPTWHAFAAGVHGRSARHALHVPA
jgi:hypothetical protein